MVQGGQLGRGPVGREDRLVQLYPRGARAGELTEQLGVDAEQFVQQVKRPEAGRGRLGQQQERQRPEQYRPGLDAHRPGLGVLAYGLAARQAQPGSGPDLRHQVVIVRVEPLRHLQRRHAISAPGHGEVGVEGWAGGAGQPGGAGQAGGVNQPGESLRDGADEHGRVQHVVVERERIGRDQGQPGVPQRLPGAAAQRGRGLGELVGADPARPQGFGGFLQLPAPADPRIPEHGCLHGCLPRLAITRGAGGMENGGVPAVSWALPRGHGPPRAGRRTGGGRSSDSRAARLPARPTGRRFPGPAGPSAL